MKSKRGIEQVMRSLLVSVIALAALLAVGTVQAQEGHGPSGEGFLSHDFQWEARSWDRPQLNLHFGLSQPLLLDGVNVATDLRYGRWVFEYSHGAGLDYSANPSVASGLGLQEGLEVGSPWTTGFGVGYTLLDEVYFMVEAKAHRYEVQWRGQRADYTTLSVGPTLAWRLFLWRGLNLTAYLRYWPTAWSSQEKISWEEGDQQLHHTPVDLGLFANLSLGWAFDL